MTHITRFRRILLTLLLLLPGVALSADPVAGPEGIRAVLTPHRQARLASRMEGRVLEVAVREGEGFREGQLLVRFDCALEQAGLDQRRAQLQGAEGRMANEARMDQLGTGRAVDLTVAQAVVAEYKAAVAEAEERIRQCRVYAPFSGRVVVRGVHPYEYAARGQTLLEVVDNAPPDVELLVPSRWIGQLQAGQELTLLLDENALRCPARITRLGARIDPGSQTVKVMAEVSGSVAGLVPGMSGQALFPGWRGE
ncbi:MAG: efflux RND transporter periplasmic adaptor subunit [Magnetococcus sp. WYHC-3]